MSRNRLTLTTAQWDELLRRGERHEVQQGRLGLACPLRLAWPLESAPVFMEHLLALIPAETATPYYLKHVREALDGAPTDLALGDAFKLEIRRT